MRPIAIDDLIKQDKPKFIRKKDRKKTEPTVTLKKRKITPSPTPAAPSSSPSSGSSLPQPKKTFNFDWDENEDTSVDTPPLVELDTLDDDIPEISVHWSQKPLNHMSDSDWRDLKDEFNIITKGCKIPPLRTWQESDINKGIIKTLNTLQLTDPTPIQRASIPIALHHRDIIGIAETGSGKTLAYIIPLINYILSIDENYLRFESGQEFNLNKPLGLILAPTRELANQITIELSKFCKSLNLKSVSIIGGHSYEDTIELVKNGVHIVVATPGRLVDCLERKIINLSKCFFVVFDEADRMIDMGFEKPLTTIYDNLGELTDYEKSVFKLDNRNTLMFTATFSDSIKLLTKKYLMNPVQLVIGKVGEKVDNINQHFDYLQDKDIDKKPEKLLKVIDKHMSRNKQYSIIIFANYVKTVEDLATELSEKGYKNITIHGSKSQLARERSIEDFKNGKTRILIATDVAARGIDIANVSLVINYQMTKKIDEYIHRIGRTGRAGTKGNSHTFIDESDEPLFGDLRKFLKRDLPLFLLDRTQTIKD